MPCVLEELSTPQTCIKKGVLVEIRRAGDERELIYGRRCSVKPLSMRGTQVNVTCDQPRGSWTLDIKDFDLDL
jgi:hypothetical protein